MFLSGSWEKVASLWKQARSRQVAYLCRSLWLLEGTGLPTNRSAFFRKKTGFQKHHQSLLPKHLRFFLKTGNRGGLETPLSSFFSTRNPKLPAQESRGGSWDFSFFFFSLAEKKAGGFSVLVLPPVVSKWYCTLASLHSVSFFPDASVWIQDLLTPGMHSALSDTSGPVATV